MTRLLGWPLLLALLALPALADEAAGPVIPFETGTGFQPANIVDACVLAELNKRGIEPANPCSDEVFVRRLYVDLLGQLPEPWDVRRFLADPRTDRRARLIDELLEHPAFVDYWTLKWGDLLRVKAEFPIKLWPNGVHAYHRWIFEAIRDDVPYDRFVRALLTSSGSNFRVAPVNFFRAIQGNSPEDRAAAVALTFMGVRFEKWSKERREGMAAFFSRLLLKPTAEWKEEILVHDPAPAPPLHAVFPDGREVTVPSDVDPRTVFADWLIDDQNPYFARAIANRVWYWLMGRGIVQEPDDIRPDNPPSNPALLLCLERALVRAHYDLKAIFRLILNSRTYQASPIPRSRDPEAEAQFAHYLVRRLDAEVLIDALCRLDDRGETYQSIVPEPFTILPDMKRSVKLEDGTITSPFLEMFGRPSRDTGYESERDNEPTSAQRLFLLNSTEVQQRLERSPWMRRLIRASGGNHLGLIRALYLALLSRTPTAGELDTAAAYFKGPGRNPSQAAIDLAWALLNSKEFLYRH